MINLDRNSITTVKATDLQMFPLKQLSINRNKLTKESKDELNKYISERPLVNVQFRFNDGEEGSDLDFGDLWWQHLIVNLFICNLFLAR